MPYINRALTSSSTQSSMFQGLINFSRSSDYFPILLRRRGDAQHCDHAGTCCRTTTNIHQEVVQLLYRKRNTSSRIERASQKPRPWFIQAERYHIITRRTHHPYCCLPYVSISRESDMVECRTKNLWSEASGKLSTAGEKCTRKVSVTTA